MPGAEVNDQFSGEGSGALDRLQDDHLVPLLLRTLSEQLSGATVALNRRSGLGTVTTVHAYDPSAEVDADLRGVVGVEVPEAGTVTERVARTGDPVVVPTFDPSYLPAGNFPDPWREFLAVHPVHSLIAAPLTVDGTAVGTLVVGRRSAEQPFTDRDLLAVRAAAERLAMVGTSGPELTPGGPPGSDPGGSPDPVDSSGWRSVGDAAVGITLPAVVAIALAQLDDPTLYRPGVVLLTITILIAVFVGFRAGVAATITSSVAIAAWFTSTPDGMGAASRLVSVTVFALGCMGVLLAVNRLDELRRSERRHRVISDALLNGAPVGIALFDTDLRFERVNDKLAEINGIPVRDHLGHRPSEFNAAAGQLYEPILESVRNTGEPVVDEDLSLDVPEFGIERHWKASYYPIRDERGTLVGVGTAVRDTTDEVIGRRRGESLLQLARELATVADETQLVASLTEFLADAFKGRALLALVDREQRRLEVASPLSGYTEDVVRAWSGFRMSFERRTPMCDAVRNRGVVHVGSDEEFARRYLEMEPERLLVGDAACVCVPVVDPVDGGVLAVFRVGWPHQRPLTDTSRTLCETVSSLVALAMNRIRLTEQLSADRFRAALDSMLHQVAIAHAERDDQGHITDFVIDYTNAAGLDGAGRGAEDLIGRSVLELYPRWCDSGMFDRFATVVDSGEPFVAERLEYHDELDDGTPIDGYWNLQVVRFGDGYLAASNDVSELVRLEHAEREAREVAKRERVAVELLQRAALPDTLPDAPGAALDAIYRPASTEQPIGGDWYDAFVLPNGRLGLVIADVSGHGPGAASFMVQVRNVFRAAAALREQPDEVLGAVNEIIHRFGSAPSYFVTCCYCTLDPRTRRMSWASAGHPAPIISAPGSAQLAEQRPGYPLAVAPDATYRLQSLALEPGDRVLLYTDGLFEQRGETIDAGLERLRALAAAAANFPVDGLLDQLAGNVADPFDDIAALLVALDR